MNNEENKKNNNLFVIILFVVVIICVLLFPVVYNYIEKEKLPEVPHEEEPKEEEKVVTEEDLADIHFPIMRNSIYSSNTYYSLDKFKISNMSNSDILYNAFMGIEETNTNIKPSDSYSRCSTTPMEFNSNLIELRVKNILGKNVEYNFENISVPVDSSSSYKGTWRYDEVNARYIYDGLCTSNEPNTKYYDIEDFIKAEYQDKDIIVYYYVGFAKVEGENYTIYSDSNMTNALNSGTSSNIDDIKTIFKNLDNNSKKIYKYTFKNTLCSYYEYCLYEGEYINEL